MTTITAEKGFFVDKLDATPGAITPKIGKTPAKISSQEERIQDLLKDIWVSYASISGTSGQCPFYVSGQEPIVFRRIRELGPKIGITVGNNGKMSSSSDSATALEKECQSELLLVQRAAKCAETCRKIFRIAPTTDLSLVLKQREVLRKDLIKTGSTIPLSAGKTGISDLLVRCCIDERSPHLFVGMKKQQGHFKQYFQAVSEDGRRLALLSALSNGEGSEWSLQDRRFRELFRKVGVRNIPELIFAGVDEERNPAVVVEDYDMDAIEFLRKGSSLIDRATLVRLGLSVAQSLYDIHELGLCHRDIKPEQILIKDEGQGWKIALTDFDFCCTEEEAESGSCPGSYSYAAPELFIGRSMLSGKKTDIFSFGITLFDIKFRRHFISVEGLVSEREQPKKTKSFHEARQWMDQDALKRQYRERAGLSMREPMDDIDEYILKMIDPNPDRRPSAEEVLEKFQSWQAEVDKAPLMMRSSERKLDGEGWRKGVSSLLSSFRRTVGGDDDDSSGSGLSN